MLESLNEIVYIRCSFNILVCVKLYIMKENSTSVKALLPVLFGFFIMGFCDVVGIATSYVKVDFELSETVAGFLPSMVFLWFLLLAVPAAIFMNRIGRKKTVLMSMLVTIVGMIIPFVDYNLYTCLMAFALLFFNIERFVGVMPTFSLNSPALIFLLAIITSIFTIILMAVTYIVKSLSALIATACRKTFLTTYKIRPTNPAAENKIKNGR